MNESIKKLWEEYRNNRENDELRNRLIEHYSPLVRRCANRIYARLNNDKFILKDLELIGHFGLLDAITNFDPNSGVSFEEYSLPYIDAAITDEIRALDWVPRLLRGKMKKMDEASGDPEEKFGHRPTEEELAEFQGLPLDEWRKTLENNDWIS